MSEQPYQNPGTCGMGMKRHESKLSGVPLVSLESVEACRSVVRPSGKGSTLIDEVFV